MGSLSVTVLGNGYTMTDYTTREKMQREVLAVRTRVLGAEHPDTLTAAGKLAVSLWRQGKYDEAEKM